MSRTRPVIRRISQTATRPSPVGVGTSRCEMIALSVPAIIARAWCCSWGGKKSMIRFTVSGASIVWTLESTRWPVSAADSAERTVSSSRISPIRITSGSWRRTRRMARWNEPVSLPTSRWLMIDARSRVQVLDRILDRDDVARLGRVDLVEHRRQRRRLARAGRTGQQDQAALLVGDVVQDGRKPELVERLDRERDRPRNDRDRAALAERVDAEPPERLDRVGEVDLTLGVELVSASPGARRACARSTRSASAGVSGS